MTDIAALDTPAVLIDLDRVEANLQRVQAYADKHGLKLRPHIKTHKLPRFARRAMELGAVGITVQKLGEAEVFADAGITEIFLPYNIIGAAKLARLKALHERVHISVTADSPETVDGLSATFATAPVPLTVLVECDTGMGRCGVQTPAQAWALAEKIAKSPGLRFGGLMTYPAAGQVEANAAWLAAAKLALTSAGLVPEIVSNGGTPDIWRAHKVTAATEHRPGTYIYMDRYQVAKGVGTFDDCALTVLATVVSRPTENRAIIDAGSKALTSDTLGLTGFGLIEAYPEAVIVGLSEEHGTIDLSNCASKPKIGDKLRIIPNHACVVSNLFDRVTLISKDAVVETVTVEARGRVD
ncbi:MAG: D-TA family PLP-dependent enzyme [Alphaproteobacteria bacterium]|nr:D-TA family PLP-dependent enzyme [Alphaproteobacteria bacterium]MBU1563058.1 D-TA family PLP-dependent enzyme [Alphaproteobacteria bacterium]MBU2304253.1 D-TA family PLP-dependent enzyme [Alphaproteobacteria bacterium]MBU2368254.1 D-TA family PLP-dependent enzyme [Alphaproteobacteria bacterium]